MGFTNKYTLVENMEIFCVSIFFSFLLLLNYNVITIFSLCLNPSKYSYIFFFKCMASFFTNCYFMNMYIYIYILNISYSVHTLLCAYIYISSKLSIWHLTSYLYVLSWGRPPSIPQLPIFSCMGLRPYELSPLQFDISIV